MEYIDVSSTNVAAVAYDDEQALLGVRFTSGREYHYFGVPRDVYDGLLSAPSVGTYFNAYVRNGGYPHQQIR